jgi:hypothetical protein
MRKLKVGKIWIPAFLLAVVMALAVVVAGCGDPDKGGGGALSGPPPVALGTACSFGILGATPVVSNTGLTHVTGDVGIWPAASITGFTGILPGGPGTITGAFHAGDGTAMTAQADLTKAYNFAAGAAVTVTLPTGNVDIGGSILTPGVYKASSSLGITGNLILDGGGNPNASWIFQIGSTLTTAAGNSHIILQNGANAHNVFWQVGSSATLGVNTPGTATIFQGTIMANASITLGTGAVLNGRALAENGAVTLDSNPVNVTACP